jgi:hypothetical protein
MDFLGGGILKPEVKPLCIWMTITVVHLFILPSCFFAPDFTERYTSVNSTSVWDIESHHIKVVDITSRKLEIDFYSQLHQDQLSCR